MTGFSARIMKMEPDIENMTLNEYLEYEAEKERRLRRNDVEIDKYHDLPPLHPCFQSTQLYTEDGLVSYNESDEVDIDSMTIEEYELYIAKQGPRKNPLNDHCYNFTSNFCDQLPCIPNPQPDDEELSFEEDINDINGWENEEAKVEDCDEGDIYDIWDITVKEVERLRQLLIPILLTLPEPDLVVQPYVSVIPFFDEVKVVRQEEPDDDIDSIPKQVPNVNDDLIQPLIPQPIHTTPPDNAYVVLDTDLILD
ncbi:hypothetical protein Tco_0656991 [Tanacetum coccineum]|uniref:Uncharacterized protein n=1 Tax=Tanacetum coccineum TaxID=301880 RepID=A0ABQ4XAB9_9ASTR